MKFLKKQKKSKKLALVISDLHLGAGPYIQDKKNPLEDFHFDSELMDFLNYYSTGEFQNKEVELVINGDFFDLLAVPYVPYFDDEFWSETASKDKLKICIEAHIEVMDALNLFLKGKGKKLTYIIGNHDAEFIFKSLQETFKTYFDEEVRDKITFLDNGEPYLLQKGIYLQHGHEYEDAHKFDPKKSIITSTKGENYIIPSWGSYYVTNVINRYKEERDYVNSVRPIKNFLIHGLIFDTFFILRFMIANSYYFFMVRFLYYYRQKSSFTKLINHLVTELELFQNYEKLTLEFFEAYPDARVLIVGHTHQPMDREYIDNTRFINTGTWTRMVNLDLQTNGFGKHLTYAVIQTFEENYELENFDQAVQIDLNEWKGITNLPYQLFR